MNARTALAVTAVLIVGTATTGRAQTASASASAGSGLWTVTSSESQDPKVTAPVVLPKVTRSTAGTDPQAPPPPPEPTTSVTRSYGSAEKTTVVQTPLAPAFERPKGQLVNVRVEFTITDQAGTKPATKKTMTMIVADRESSRIRTNGEQRIRGMFRQTPLSVDVLPIVEGRKIRLEFSLEYTLVQEPDQPEALTTNVSERLSAVLDSDVPLIIAQSSDAVTDRRLTIEVKATILK
jgi:hypothetical protein